MTLKSLKNDDVNAENSKLIQIWLTYKAATEDPRILGWIKGKRRKEKKKCSVANVVVQKPCFVC